jgi:heme-degrading monooxygenase HmoA
MEITSMFIAVNTMAVPASQQERVVQEFERRAGDLKHLKGSLGLELWRSDDALLVVSRWESKEAMQEYVNHPMFRRHHPTISHDEMKQANFSFYDAIVLT